MPNKNDPIYRCFDGKLEIYVFIEESISTGATQPTWVLKKCFDDGKKIRTSKKNYYESAKLAYQDYLEECKQAIIVVKKQIMEIIEHYGYIMTEITRVQDILDTEQDYL